MAANTLLVFFEDNYWEKKAALQEANFESVMNTLLEYKRASKILVRNNSNDNNSNSNDHSNNNGISNNNNNGATADCRSNINDIAKDICNFSLVISTEVLLAFFVEGNLDDNDHKNNDSEVIIAKQTKSTMGVLCSYKESAPFETLKRRYKPLIIALQKSRPSFAKTLLSELVRKLCKLEKDDRRRNNTDNGSGIDKSLGLIVSWIFWLSSR